MPGGGKLIIKTENFIIDASYAERFPDVTPGNYVAISVVDTGIGMPADVVARAFDPFFTTKPIGQGTGLGLSMVYGFARQSKGHVRIISTPGQGTTVRLKLPRNLADTVSEPVAATAAGVSPPMKRATILLVDDEPQLRRDLAELLMLSGYQVRHAADGAEALRLMHDGQHVDMLVSDVGLPNGMNGRQLADTVQLQWPELPVLLITGYADVEVMQREALPPGMEVMRKPFSLAAFLKKVGAMLKNTPDTQRMA